MQVMSGATEGAVAAVCLCYSAVLTLYGERFWAVYFDEPVELDDGHSFMSEALSMLLACYAWTVLAPRVRLVQAVVWAAALAFVLKNAYMISPAFAWLHIATSLGILASLLLL
jgi:hypothetical protein